MILLECDSKALLQGHGLPVPRGIVLEGPEVPADLGPALFVKAQVPAWDRAAKGGIVRVGTPGEAREAAARMFERSLDGYRVRRVLVEEAVTIARELYLSISVDREVEAFRVLVSAEGGTGIEARGAGVQSEVVDPLLGLQRFQIRRLVRSLGLPAEARAGLERLLADLYRAFRALDAELLEVNPLALTPAGGLVALDAKLVIDENALVRHPELPPPPGGETFEDRVRDLGGAGVAMGGDIGVITSGAGVGMATVDAVVFGGGTVSAWVDLGGVILFDPAKLAQVIDLVKALGPRAFLFNFFFQIGRCDILAGSILQALGREPLPVIIRLKGRNEDEARAILKSSPFRVTDAMPEAVRLAVAAAKG